MIDIYLIIEKQTLPELLQSAESPPVQKYLCISVMFIMLLVLSASSFLLLLFSVRRGVGWVGGGGLLSFVVADVLFYVLWSFCVVILFLVFVCCFLAGVKGPVVFKIVVLCVCY